MLKDFSLLLVQISSNEPLVFIKKIFRSFIMKNYLMHLHLCPFNDVKSLVLRSTSVQFLYLRLKNIFRAQGIPF